MRTGRIGFWVVAAVLVAGVARARDLEDILRDKGIINEREAKEAKGQESAKPASLPASLPEWLSRLTLFGDVRIRNEVFFRKGDPDRNRDRFRLRFGAKVKPSDEIEVGFKLATGNASDPISNNQTFTDEFTPKNINIANAYVKLTPAKSLGLDRPWLTLVGGKFDVPLYALPTLGELVWDKDLTPEGFFESLKPVEQKEGFVRGLALNLGQWIIEENTKTGEAAIYAFQGVGNFAIGDILGNVAVGDYKFVDPSSIAVARTKNTALNITNTVTLSDGTVVGGRPIDPTKFGPNKDGLDANGKPITITKLNRRFNEVDAAADVLIPTGIDAFPLRVFGDYVKNTDAGSSNDQGYQAGVTIGSSKDAGDIAFTYGYERLETDAVLSAFTGSDFGHDGGTNTKAHILQAGYVLSKHLSLLSTAYIDKPVENVSGRSAETDVRWQVDLIAKF